MCVPSTPAVDDAYDCAKCVSSPLPLQVSWCEECAVSAFYDPIARRQCYSCINVSGWLRAVSPSALTGGAERAQRAQRLEWLT